MNKLDRQPVSPELRAWCWAQTEGRCWYCSDQLGWGLATFVIDHQFPRSRGGESSQENCVASCMDCNHDKSTSNLEQYRGLVKKRLEIRLESLKKYLRGTAHEHCLSGVSFEKFRFFGERNGD